MVSFQQPAKCVFASGDNGVIIHRVSGDNRMSRRPITIVDDKTGESLGVTVPKGRPGARYSYVGGFVVISVDGIRLIQMAGVRGRSLELLWALIKRVRGNVVSNASSVALCEELDMDSPNVSRCLNNLIRAGMVMRGATRTELFINPYIGYRGNSGQQRAAVRDWDEAHKPVPVLDQDKMA